ncbi:ABC-2 type transport system permease protein [Pseudonocardia sediminis]|uniref:ABC-2 type transport system permease protein n=1 Tax=Pseudonocardia sediminis TaxID=1397368 RepID=A0A4Q7UUS2_PSEST|nr:ABC transporter permease [Pseudonocardia sediminis]RZT83779.1 ABC-2 type transport system permease protein [Pseudonocardia sediminis]
MTTSLGARETITLVARREIRTQLRSRSFVYGLLIIIAIFAMYGLIFAFIGSQGSSATLGVTPQARPAVAAVQEAARSDGFDLTTVDVTPAAGTEQVRSGDLDALLTGGPGSYELVGRDSIDSDVSRLVTQTVRAQALDQALRAAGTDPAALAQASTVRSQTLEPEDPLQGQRLGIAIAVAVLLFFSLSNYGGAVAQGVVEEKSSRVVELLLSTIKPLHLLAGKVIGLGLVGLLQLLILGAIATTGALAFGVISVPTTVIAALGQAVLWYLLGFFLFATLYASAGALVSRQEELQSAITPLAFLVMIPFVVTVSVLPNDPRNPLVTVLSFIPFFAPTTMPARVALGVAPWWQVLVAALLTLAAIVGMVWLSARIYQNSVLRTGAKVSWREGLTGARS